MINFNQLHMLLTLKPKFAQQIFQFSCFYKIVVMDKKMLQNILNMLNNRMQTRVKCTFTKMIYFASNHGLGIMSKVTS